ncbi:hypothetical protein [Bradyrhizobium aeschynomenes]|uniref:hypothetical protein n=1 Tax=Bradyrhizobium aeschynomenes TaxID=2734909 RepID=UPI0035DE6EFB
MTFDDVRALALAWPEVEDGTSYGTPALKVRKKLLTRLKEDGDSLAPMSSRCCSGSGRRWRRGRRARRSMPAERLALFPEPYASEARDRADIPCYRRP